MVGLLLIVMMLAYFVPRASSFDRGAPQSTSLSLSASPLMFEGWTPPEGGFFGQDLVITATEDRSFWQEMGFEPRLATIHVEGTFYRLKRDREEDFRWLFTSSLPIVSVAEWGPLRPRPDGEEGQRTEVTGWSSPVSTDQVIAYTIAGITTDDDNPYDQYRVIALFKVAAPVLSQGVDGGAPVQSWAIDWLPFGDSRALWYKTQDPTSGEDVGWPTSKNGQVVIRACPLCDIHDVYGDAKEPTRGEPTWQGLAAKALHAEFTTPWRPWNWMLEWSWAIWSVIIASVAGVFAAWLIPRLRGEHPGRNTGLLPATSPLAAPDASVARWSTAPATYGAGPSPDGSALVTDAATLHDRPPERSNSSAYIIKGGRKRRRRRRR
jgi:hypothetical protein